jgi:hypothetical protein
MTRSLFEGLFIYGGIKIVLNNENKPHHKSLSFVCPLAPNLEEIFPLSIDHARMPKLASQPLVAFGMTTCTVDHACKITGLLHRVERSPGKLVKGAITLTLAGFKGRGLPISQRSGRADQTASRVETLASFDCTYVHRN